MKKRLSLDKLEVKSFVTEVHNLTVKGGDDTYRLACTAEDCSVASCGGGYCPKKTNDPGPGTDDPRPTEFDSVCIPL
ncbi:MAG: pinensin family lanthipeptide [Cyclobacteriaceae bacterium]